MTDDTVHPAPTTHYCSNCGAPLAHEIPAGDDRPRAVCRNCDTVHYENPRVLVSVIAIRDSSILWLRRAVNPRAGFWALPSGFMELGETLQQAAVRETREEVGIELDKSTLILYTVGALDWMGEVYVVFRAPLPPAAITTAGPEALEVALFAEDELPWDQLAFPEIIPSVRQLYSEVQSGRFGVYVGEVTRAGGNVMDNVLKHFNPSG